DWIGKSSVSSREGQREGSARTSGRHSQYSANARSVSRPVRVHNPNIVANHLSPELEALARQVKVAGKKLSEESEQQDFIAAHDRLTALAAELEMWRTHAQKGTVYWLEKYQSRRGMPRLTLSAAPLDVGPAMREQLFDKVPTVIMTSA